jgi:hypothetical protein
MYSVTFHETVTLACSSDIIHTSHSDETELQELQWRNWNMQLGPPSESTSRSAIQEFLNIWWNPKVHYGVQHLVPILSQMKPLYSTISCFSCETSGSIKCCEVLDWRLLKKDSFPWVSRPDLGRICPLVWWWEMYNLFLPRKDITWETFRAS